MYVDDVRGYVGRVYCGDFFSQFFKHKNEVYFCKYLSLYRPLWKKRSFPKMFLLGVEYYANY